MLVDQAVLRAFARETSEAGGIVRAANLCEPVMAGPAGMAGSTTAWASRLVGEFVTESVRALADGYAGLAATAAGNADSYEVSDEDFSAATAAVFPE